MTLSRMGQYISKDEQKQTFMGYLGSLFTALPASIMTGKIIPDVSYWDGVIDWDIMAAKTDAVIIRAGQGNFNADTQFTRNWTEAKKRKMYRGVYWFYDDRESPGSQAARFANMIKDDLPEMEVWIDWEIYYGGSFGGLAQVVAMMQEVKRLLPTVKIGMYTGYYWFMGNSNAVTNAPHYAWLKANAVLWLAWYTANYANVKIPSAWSDLLLWQYTGDVVSGAEYGTKSKIDLNRCNFDFNARYNGVPTPPPTPQPMTVQQEGTSLTSLYIRKGVYPAEIVGGLAVGDKVLGNIDPLTEWFHIRSIFRVNTGTTEKIDAWCSANPVYLRVANLPAGVFRVKTWIIPEDGMKADGIVAKGTFQEVPLFSPVGGFGAVSQFQRLGTAEYNALSALQNPNDGYSWTVKQKLGWLINDTSTAVNEYWYEDAQLVYGTMINGGNLVQVEVNAQGLPVEYHFNATYRAETGAKHDIVFYKVLGLRKAQIAEVAAKKITHATHPHLIHKATVAYPTNSRFADHTPKGMIYTPVWDARDYPANTGSELYIAKAFLY